MEPFLLHVLPNRDMRENKHKGGVFTRVESFRDLPGKDLCYIPLCRDV
jgi:hypothetical protein